MGFLNWCSRCAGGLSMLALIGLSYWVISRETIIEDYGFIVYKGASTKEGSYSSKTTAVGAGIWTIFFAYYCLLIHFLVALFPIRACWSIWSITKSLKQSAQSRAVQDYKTAGLRRQSSSSSITSSETLSSSDSDNVFSTASEFTDSESELSTEGKDSAQSSAVIHAIVIPNYKEDMEILRETLDVLASHPQAQSCYDVSRNNSSQSHSLVTTRGVVIRYN